MPMENAMMIQCRIRPQDTLILDYLKKIPKGDQSYEIRRLLSKAIKIEQKEKIDNNFEPFSS